MRIDIGFRGQRTDASRSVCIVVDVLRASSSIVTLLERGCERVVAAADIADARRLKQRLPSHLLCGEADGLPPDGFDYGNSPVEFSRLDLAGKSIILATTNGTRVIADCADEASAVLVGCLLNRKAVAQAAVLLAKKLGADIAVVCAGDAGSSGEDLAAARAIVDVVRGSAALEFDAGREVLESRHAEELRAIGLGDDVEFCARLDVSEVVPVLQVEDGLLQIVCHPGV